MRVGERVDRPEPAVVAMRDAPPTFVSIFRALVAPHKDGAILADRVQRALGTPHGRHERRLVPGERDGTRS